MQSRCASWCVCHAVTLRLGRSMRELAFTRNLLHAASICEVGWDRIELSPPGGPPLTPTHREVSVCSREVVECESTFTTTSIIHGVIDSAESCLCRFFVSRGYRADIVRTHGECAAKYRTDTVRISRKPSQLSGVGLRSAQNRSLCVIFSTSIVTLGIGTAIW